ncbi:MAG TPA: DUF72 domain-containing protein [Verrucomicrobiae bacterium]|nr:DUF72 domain-containing protein [Verrucomicrobiae bacterium]
MVDASILIGTAGWSYPDWENVVYPAGKAADRLRAVARYLDCVEVDSSFYHPPAARTTESWVRTLEQQPGFRFLAKAWQRFTHERSMPWTRAEHDLLTTGLQPLREAGRLDSLLFQFPWSFRNDPKNRDWLDAIADAFADWPLAVEVRHDSWLADGTLEFFRERRLTFCNIDQPVLAHCLPPTAHVTAEVGYFRVHGRNAKNWFREKQDAYGGRYDYLYSAMELDELLAHVTKITARTKKTFVVFNNHKDGKAFANALQFKARLVLAATVRAPVSLREGFPVLRACTVPDGAEQLPLV